MPDIDGLTLVKMFRNNEATRETPLIVLSAKEEATTKAEAFGVTAFAAHDEAGEAVRTHGSGE